MSGEPSWFEIGVADAAKARAFYGGVLGCSEGRSADDWVDFDFYGHQIVAHRVEGAGEDAGGNPVDCHDVPVPHFGVVLDMPTWQALADRLVAAGTRFRKVTFTRVERNR